MARGQNLVTSDSVLPFIKEPAIPAMDDAAVKRSRALEALILKQPQIEFHTRHIIHGGVYLRTVYIPAGIVMSGALIRINTTCILTGHVTAYIGTDEPLEFTGHNILPASANRKLVVYAHTDVEWTMLFPTDAQTVEEAEAQFTDEADMLASNKDDNMNTILITGEN